MTSRTHHPALWRAASGAPFLLTLPATGAYDDRGTFTGHMRSLSVGLDWYPNRHAIVRSALIYRGCADNVVLDDGTVHDEFGVLLEVQLHFWPEANWLRCRAGQQSYPRGHSGLSGDPSSSPKVQNGRVGSPVEFPGSPGRRVAAHSTHHGSSNRRHDGAGFGVLPRSVLA